MFIPEAAQNVIEAALEQPRPTPELKQALGLVLPLYEKQRRRHGPGRRGK